MELVGNLVLKGLGQIKNARIDNVATDPLVPSSGQVWYNTTDGHYRGFDGTAVITFATGGSTEALLTEIDAIEAATGLNADGTLPSLAATNYLSGKTSLFAALVELDAQAKATNDAAATAADAASTLTTKVENIVTADGLNTDGTFNGLTGSNYATAATTTREAILAVDAQVKTNADAIAQNVTDIGTKVSKAGDTMTGNLAFGGTFSVTGLAAPVNAGDAATKAYTDNLVNGLSWLPPVDIIADVLPVATEGMRVLLSTDNKIYTRGPTVFDAGVAPVSGQAVMVKFDESGWTTDGTTWVQFTGAGQITAGIGLVKSGNVIDINMGAGIGQLPTDEVGIDVLAAGALFLTVDGSAASTDTAAQLSVKLDGSTLARSTSGLKVGAAGVSEVELATSVAGSGLTGGAGAALSVVVGDGVSVIGNAVSLDLTFADARFLNTSGDTLTGALITAGAPSVALEVANKAYVDAVTTALEASTFTYTGASAASSHVVTHNLGSKYNQVMVVDSADKQIFPDSVTFDTVNQLTVGFNSAITCKIVVTGKYVAA
jgi:hypothetical protein